MYAGVSSLRNHQVKMDVIGNNIANVNTPGFKFSRVTFEDVLSQTLRGASGPTAERGGINPLQVGLGMEIAGIETIYTQGNLEYTGKVSDLAIQGEGFFITSDGENKYYTRAGMFTVDSKGNLVTPTGLKVQGWNADENGVIQPSSILTDVIIPFGQKIPARATTEIVFASNLKASAGKAVLEPGNTAGITQISGICTDIEGGTHYLTFTDGLADRVDGTTALGNTVTDKMEDILDNTLASYGVTDATGLQIETAPGTFITITGLSTTSTIEDLITAINGQVAGVTAQLINDGANNWVLQVIANSGGTGNLTNITDTGTGDIASVLGLGAATPGDNLTTNVTVLDTFVKETGGKQFRKVFSGAETALAGVSGNWANGTGLINGVTIGNTGDTFVPGTARITTSDNFHSTSIVVYDSQGSSHLLRFDFQKIGLNRWSWQAVSQEGYVLAGNTGFLTFSSDGLLSDVTGGPIIINSTNNPTWEADSLSIIPNFGSGVSGVTQFESDFTTTAKSQDGFSSGILESYTTDLNGIVTGFYTNGLRKNIAQIALAIFPNPSGLLKRGETSFQESNNSGSPLIGTANTGGRGSIMAGTLEMSNVDLAEQFSQMIITQRGFQANARVIMTSDEILTDLVALKR
jgi:flagellar hook protein FlgE